jgi:capsular polysaccharide biosynthesis protein
MSEQRPGPDLDAEREIDLHSIWRRLTDRWWLPAGGLIAGAVLGALVSGGGGGEGFAARAVVYVGQPYAPTGNQIRTLESYPGTISRIISSEPVTEKAAVAAGLRPDQLLGNVTSQSITASGRPSGSVSPLVEITVQATVASKAERAAASLANSVTAQISSYVDRKIELLNEQVARNDKAIVAARARLQETFAAQKRVLEDKRLGLAERILIQANSNSTLEFYEARLTNRQADRTAALQLLSLATEVERSRVVTPAAAVRVPAASRRNEVLVGALIGLLAGAFAAYLADPLLRRRNGRAQAA